MTRLSNTPDDVFDDLPHRGLEAWKWTDLRAAVDGRELSGLTQAMDARLSGADDLSVDRVDADEGLDAMTQIAATVSESAVRIDVPEGYQSDTPIVLTDLQLGHSQILVNIGKGASIRIEEQHEAQDGFANLDIRYTVKEGATLHRQVVTNDGETVVRNVRAQVTLWDGAKFDQVLLTTGSALTRLETRLACMGEVEANLSGAYMLSGKRHADITHYTDLAAPNCVIRDEVAGVTTGQSRGVFQGKFHVRRPAQKTDAEMRHDALLLGERSRINAKPELEIYADDVECEHGNTIGQLDESALFYMRQRGIPLSAARALLIEAFIAAKLRGDEALIERVQNWLKANIG